VRGLRALDSVQNFLQFDLHNTDGLPAFGDALLDLLLLAVVVAIVGRHIQVRQLVTELLLGLHHGLQLDKDGR